MQEDIFYAFYFIFMSLGRLSIYPFRGILHQYRCCRSNRRCCMKAQNATAAKLPVELIKDLVFEEFDLLDTTFYQAEVSLLEVHFGELLQDLLSGST